MVSQVNMTGCKWGLHGDVTTQHVKFTGYNGIQLPLHNWNVLWDFNGREWVHHGIQKDFMRVSWDLFNREHTDLRETTYLPANASGSTANVPCVQLWELNRSMMECCD